MTAEFTEGAQAFGQGTPAHECPYFARDYSGALTGNPRANDAKAREWIEGFIHAKKQG